jgi:hypothetical protein
VGAAIRVEVKVGDRRTIAIDLPKLREIQISGKQDLIVLLWPHLHILMPLGCIDASRGDNVDAKKLRKMSWQFRIYSQFAVLCWQA